jgi:hypothetical protein
MSFNVFKPVRKNVDPKLWIEWKKLRDIEQKMRQSIITLDAIKEDTCDFEVACDSVVELMNKLSKRMGS